MSKKSKYKYEGYGVVRDTEIDFPYHTDDIVDLLDEKDQQITDLQKQLAITEKALELACERVKYFEEMQDKEMGFYEFFGYDSDYDLKAIIEQYKQQAKEMLENE